MKKREKTREKAHPTNSEVESIKKDIRSLMNSGKSDIEIRETLGLELRTYQKYTHIIHLEDQKVLLSITQEQLGTELLRMKQSLEETYKISKDIALDPKCQDKIGMSIKEKAKILGAVEYGAVTYVSKVDTQ